MSIPWALATHPGQLRPNNEDYARAVPELALFVVADGMGGHVAGEVASHLASDTLVDTIRARKKPKRIMDEGPLLGEAILVAHDAVLQESRRRDLQGMGTTLTALKVRGRTATIGHVGDSRAAMVHRGRLTPLTQDHTLVALMVETGAIPVGDAAEHPERHILTQAIGPAAEIDPEITQARIPRGARILLSSDGLHDIVPEQEIVDIVGDGDLEAAVNRLVERANELGGPDNITALLVEP